MVRFEDLPREDLRRIQLKLTDMLFFLDDICAKHGLRYYAIEGTCIGAARHHGFIPWDDDLDIAMPRKDYEEFYRLLLNEEKNDRYIPVRTTPEMCIGWHIMQLRDASTTCIYSYCKDCDIPQGLKIDIIPLDGVPNGKLRRKIQHFWTMVFGLFAAQRIPNNGPEKRKVWAKRILNIVRSPRIRTWLWMTAEKQFSKYPYDCTDKLINLNTKSLKPISMFSEPARMEFEGRMICVPTEWDEYLRSIYKDYMSYPPVEKQKPVTVVEYLDIDHSYRELPQYAGR